MPRTPTASVGSLFLCPSTIGHRILPGYMYGGMTQPPAYIGSGSFWMAPIGAGTLHHHGAIDDDSASTDAPANQPAKTYDQPYLSASVR